MSKKKLKIAGVATDAIDFFDYFIFNSPVQLYFIISLM